MKKLYKRTRSYVYNPFEPIKTDYVVSDSPLISQKPDIVSNIKIDPMFVRYDTFEFIADIPDEDIVVLKKYGFITEL